jgi:hypothetical protein
VHLYPDCQMSFQNKLHCVLTVCRVHLYPDCQMSFQNKFHSVLTVCRVYLYQDCQISLSIKSLHIKSSTQYFTLELCSLRLSDLYKIFNDKIQSPFSKLSIYRFHNSHHITLYNSLNGTESSMIPL